MVDEGLPAAGFDLDQPQDHVAIALAPPTHGGQAVSDSRLEGFESDGDAGIMAIT